MYRFSVVPKCFFTEINFCWATNPCQQPRDWVYLVLSMSYSAMSFLIILAVYLDIEDGEDIIVIDTCYIVISSNVAMTFLAILQSQNLTHLTNPENFATSPCYVKACAESVLKPHSRNCPAISSSCFHLLHQPPWNKIRF